MATLKWGEETTSNFITNVGLVTSVGVHGQNIMACEWTHHLSYDPALIAICIRDTGATAENIRKTKEFGVSLTSVDQNSMSSISGGHTGKTVDKVGALKELGFKFYEGKKIKPLMVKDAALNVECKLYKEIELGDHIMFVGKAVEIKNNSAKPAALHDGKYWKMSNPLDRVSDKKREEMKKVIDKFRK